MVEDNLEKLHVGHQHFPWSFGNFNGHDLARKGISKTNNVFIEYYNIML